MRMSVRGAMTAVVVSGLVAMAPLGCSDAGTDSYRRTPGGIAFLDRGEGAPVLLIHGSFVEAAMLPLSEDPALSQFRRIIIHRRGYGQSRGHDSTVSIAGDAADALAVLRHLGIGRAHVVGYSYGGVVAFEMARSSPSSVLSLVLIEPPLPLVGADTAGPPAFVVEAVEGYQAGNPDAAVETFFQGISDEDWRSTVERGYRGAIDQVTRNAPQFFEYELAAIRSSQVDSQLAAAVTMPVLYVVSDGGPPMHGERLALLHAWLPNVESVVITDADHLLPIEQPAALGKAIARFVLRQEDAAGAPD